MNWYEIIEISENESGKMNVKIHIPSDSQWFSGHFPGNPILPGIAQLGMVADLIESIGSKKYTVSGVKKVRFKRMIRPEDEIEIVLSPGDENRKKYSFTIRSGGETACSGMMSMNYIEE